MRRAPRRVWFVLFPDSRLLDLAGPWEVLAQANELLGGNAYVIEAVTPLPGDVRTRFGVLVGGVRTLPSRPSRWPDTLVIAGGSPRLPLPPAERHFVPWLRRQHARLPRLVSICTGAFMLGEAGLIDGRRATSHWRFAGELQARFPRALVVNDAIFVRAGKIWSSAGISSGIDLALALVEEEHGHALAMAVAKELVLFLRRTGGQQQFSSALRRQAEEPAELRGISSFVLDHLDEALPVTRLAHAAGMSVRSFTRHCKAELGASPAELVRHFRVDEAKRLLEDTALPLKEVARRTGLGDASTLWRAFTDRLGVTPAAYRERFAAAPLGALTESAGLTPRAERRDGARAP